jgi:hypothetical protein
MRLSFSPGPRRPAARPTGARLLPALLLAATAAACAAGTAAPEGTPVPDPGASARELVAATEPTRMAQVNFGWTLDESGSRVRGRGVVRLQPPDRLRLDLFGPRNESVLAAALVGDEARLPAGARPTVAIPSPALLWAGLGAIRPPRDAALATATTTGEATILRYQTPSGEVYEYQVLQGAEPRLQQLQRLGSRGPLETVSLERGDSGEISRARYRDWAAYRDLTLDIESTVDAEGFPEEIWTP